MSFSGKVVLVTGASSGIGAATAVLFAKEGARVALVARNEAKLGSVAQQCSQRGSPPFVIKADVSKEKEASTIVEKTVNRFGKLDVLVNNAGIFRSVSITDPNILETFDEVMNTNLRSIIQLTNLAAPHLKMTEGNIVNVSSKASENPGEVQLLPYAVSKAALDNFTRTAALELAETGVRVNSVNPGPVRTDILENSGLAPVGSGSSAWEPLAKFTALGRIGEPEEVAELIAFLASNKAKSITGSVYVC